MRLGQESNMNITSHEEYGLRCALQLARHFGQGPIAASKVAEKEGISVEYVAKFMHLFRRAGVVQSVRGTQGGFNLAKSPSEVSLEEVLNALNPKRSEISHFCGQFRGHQESCLHIHECSVRPVWGAVTTYFILMVSRLKLSDLLQPEAAVSKRVEQVLLDALNSTDLKDERFSKLASA